MCLVSKLTEIVVEFLNGGLIPEKQVQALQALNLRHYYHMDQVDFKVTQGVRNIRDRRRTEHCLNDYL